VLILAIGGIAAAVAFRIPQQLGLVPDPNRLLAGTPDRAAAADLTAELSAAGIDTTGLTIYVLTVEGSQGTLAYAVLDPSAGFAFPAASTGGDSNPIFRMFTTLAESPTIDAAGVEQIAVEYRDESGQRLGTFTAKTAAIRDLAAGRIDSEAFSDQLAGDIDAGAAFGSAAGSQP
jgi:hypothetical protein